MHLIRRLERIERDLEELDRLQDVIQEDREYARPLRESMIEETGRLVQLKKRIYGQVVKTSTGSLLASPELTLEQGKSTSSRKNNRDSQREPHVELILPSLRKRTDVIEEKPATPAGREKSAPIETRKQPPPRTPARKEDTPPATDAPFKFVYPGTEDS